MLNILGVALLMCVTCVAGIVVFAYYVEQGCDPYTNKDVSNSNQVHKHNISTGTQIQIYGK